MKKYTSPEMQIQKIESKDIITLSIFTRKSNSASVSASNDEISVSGSASDLFPTV